MFSNLIKLLCAGADTKPYVLGREMGYKTPSAFQKVTTGKDIRLTVLLAICSALGYTITISNWQGFSVNLNDYYNQQHQTEQPEQPEQ